MRGPRARVPTSTGENGVVVAVVKRVILCRPAGPRNVGAVLRAVANFGPCELAVVAPKRPSVLTHPDFVQMSHGVEDAAARLLQFDNITDALADCHYAVGFTARVRGHRDTRDWNQRSAELAERGEDPNQRLALVFGTEETGLDRDEALQCMELVHIATSNEHTSLNLSMAVVVALHTLFQGESPTRYSNIASPVVGSDRAYLKQHLRDVLGGIARSDAARRDIEESIERVFSHSEIENRDARSWHTILRALGSRATPLDYGLVAKERDARRDDALRKALKKGRDQVLQERDDGHVQGKLRSHRSRSKSQEPEPGGELADADE